MASGEELGQDSVEELDLARRKDKFVIDEAGGLTLSSTLSKRKGYWQILGSCMSLLLRPLTPADLLVHVQRPRRRTNYEDSPLPILVTIGDHLVLLHLLVDLALQCTHADLDHLLNLIRQLILDVLLQTPQQEWPEDLVQTLDDDKCLFFVQPDLVSDTGVGEQRVEPLVIRLDGVEDLRENEVEEGPKVPGGTSEDEAVAGVVVGSERLYEFTLSVLHTVVLI